MVGEGLVQPARSRVEVPVHKNRTLAGSRAQEPLLYVLWPIIGRARSLLGSSD